jgi:hypothetical protein
MILAHARERARTAAGGRVTKRPPPPARAQPQLWPHISLSTCRWGWARNGSAAHGQARAATADTARQRAKLAALKPRALQARALAAGASAREVCRVGGAHAETLGKCDVMWVLDCDRSMRRTTRTTSRGPSSR